jgi:glucose/arabinose dehydrogenase
VPDGRMLVASQPGQLRLYEGSELLPTPALDLSGRVCSNYERGLLGVAVDPDFATNRYVYVYYTFDKFGACPRGQPSDPENPINRVSRFVMNGDTVDLSSERVLIDNIPSPNGNHNGGDLKFGKDGYLYVSVGDGGCDYAGDSGCAGANDASRDRNVLLGKVLRVTRNGGIPPDNPFQEGESARCAETGRTDAGRDCQETFAWGFRNPFRMGFDPDAQGTRFFVNDVGQNAWEEVNRVQAGADYGWNLCEGTHDNSSRPGSVDCSGAAYTPPVHEYGHDAGCSSITGAAFVPDNVSWPERYDDSYLFGDYVCGKIFELRPDAAGDLVRTEFVAGLETGGPVDMAFDPFGENPGLYYTTYANGGEVHRVAHVDDAGGAPSAVLDADPTSGAVPLTVAFDGSGSSGSSGEALTYLWDFGDGSPPQTTDTPTTRHTYSESGTYTATLTVRDPSGAEDTAKVRIEAGNRPPRPEIESPVEDQTFAVGENIVLRGNATDPEDGSLGGGNLSWRVLQHHNNSHTHPYLSPTAGDSVEITAPAPEDLFATDPAGNYLEVRLTATDSAGLSRTVTRVVRPNAVDVTLESQPSGIPLSVNGTTVDAPKTLTSWEAYELEVSAPRQIVLAETTHLFEGWSDGGAPRHVIVTGAEPRTYTASYTQCTIAGTPLDDVLDGTPGDDVICGLDGDDTLRGDGGEDTLRSGAGDDTLAGGEGSDIIISGQGSDRLNGGARTDLLRAGGGDDELFGGDGDDRLNSEDGVSGNDNVDGGDGTDDCVSDATEASIAGCP